MTRIAQELRRWRLYLDISQAEAAERLQVSLRSYSRWETGNSWPAYRTWQRIMAHIRATGRDEAFAEELAGG